MNTAFQIRPNTQAAKAASSRAAIHLSTMKKLLPELRARAFTVAYLSNLQKIETIRDTIASIASGSKTWSEAKPAIAKELEPILGKQAAATTAKRIISSETAKAVSVARYREITHPAELQQFPYWQYKSVGDGRVREAHAALNKLTLPANDPFWQNHFPPWDYGCRYKILQISADKAAQMRQHNRPHLVENEEALKTLRAGYIQSGHGIADIRAPEQKAITEQERFQAYRHNPGDLHLSLQNIRQKYLDNPTKKDLFLAFAAASKTQILEKASGKTVWDWLCEDDLLADAKQCLEHVAQTGNEMAITRHYDTGEWHTTSFGDEKSVDIDLPDAPHTSIHCHPNGLNTPKPAASSCAPGSAPKPPPPPANGNSTPSTASPTSAPSPQSPPSPQPTATPPPTTPSQTPSQNSPAIKVALIVAPSDEI